MSLARSAALSKLTHTELVAQASPQKQPPNFLSPRGRLIGKHIYIYTHIWRNTNVIGQGQRWS